MIALLIMFFTLQHLQKGVGRKDAEISRITHQLEKADNILCQREDNLQVGGATCY